MGTVQVESRLAATAERVWAHAATFAGVNRELMPRVRMRPPRGTADRRLDEIASGERVGRCWMLLFGLVPFDYDDLTLVEVWPGRGFLERSSMLSMRVWEHERTIEVAAEGGCVVRDRLSFEPGLPVPLGFVVRALFRHRHRRLRRLFVDAAG